MMAVSRQGQRNISVQQPRLLLVEGNDDEWFFRRLIEKRSIADIQIIQYSEEGKLGDFLVDVLVLDPRFSEVVKAIGVVKDADRGYESAFQSVQDSLARAKLSEAGIRSETYIMPDNGSQGDLETLCLSAVRESPAMPCVDRYLDCLQAIDRLPRQESKVRLRAFLSANPENPTLLIGQAIEAGVIPWDSPAFASVHQFLDMLTQ
jgi:hypothetical protein